MVATAQHARAQHATVEQPHRGHVIEITETMADEVVGFLVGTDADVHFERRGSRTFLVTQ